MSGYTELIIPPGKFNNCNVAQVVISMEAFCEVLLTGTVFNTRGEAIEGAVVRITAVNSLWQRKILGYVVTNQFGEFAVTVEKNSNIDYQLDIYEPILRDEERTKPWHTQ
ncbi:peptidase associated/transthyretin-like domain-containing protein [Lacrimispora algidixylanolytica]|uniref:Carboxypeptidase regulatory-like domain-containing protein n=1 Tax=Lacrimispora algidixylanolytica TaxID=94868 RepID=A0A419TCL3_9FIRM|nr:carboxypeptidase-like regulatory domain-containing protein [Lacrimispora algidixylanolytica]RKD35221.1 hypothetical protein BET01_02435 [Lacrimispora algidixylanolytica]